MPAECSNCFFRSVKPETPDRLYCSALPPGTFGNAQGWHKVAPEELCGYHSYDGITPTYPALFGPQIGPAGAQGPQGVQGPAGAQGVPGPSGANGAGIDDTLMALHTPAGITSGTGTLGTASGFMYWKRRGNMVDVRGAGTITTNGTGATHLQIELPFESLAHSVISAADLSTHESLTGIIFGGTTNAKFYKRDGTYPGANGFSFIFSGAYEKTP